MDVFSKYSFLIPAGSKNPQEDRDAFRTSQIEVLGQPQSAQMDEGGKWKNEVRTDLFSTRRIRLQF